ncbi:CHAT domain-containing protein [Rhodococcus pyridinivorans]|uniref:CHAT domain-containing protein n=1 Tax=Rhodococcus pyridinivorans TaxID=103816 RepID=UPI001E4810D7|nr:CHAT domain-containing protein [Rhodococcus pyridinivorans]MCD5422691.1 CHAT domain-containing protein [Rhodococcus pyridinivorans]
MNDFVVRLHKVKNENGRVASSLDDAPIPVPDQQVLCLFDLDDVANLHGQDVVRQVGEMLAAKLCENDAVKTVLQSSLAHQIAPPSKPVYFRVDDDIAHRLSWESLIGNGNFLALDDRWPIARIPRGGAVPRDAAGTFVPPLRLVCVLSAVGRSGIEEWNGIYAAVRAARKRLPIHVTLFTGDEERVFDVVEALDDPDVRVRLIGAPAPDVPSLVQLLESTEPHILHLFCHGTAAGNERRLEIGSVRDFDRDEEVSSVVVRVEELAKAVARTGTWAVVLNTCKGAEAVDDALTHAEQVVNNGVPIAIGMRRQIDAADANAFSAAFYPMVFERLAAALTAGPGDYTIDWVDTLLESRRRLRDIHGVDPALHDSWTVPVHYTRPGTFTLHVSPPTTSEPTVREELGETRVVGGLVDVLGPDAPLAVLDELRTLTGDSP